MILQLALGIITAIGGFLDAGSLATAAVAGALFGFQLVWVVVVATGCIILLTEMCGRLAAVSRHTLTDAIRERLGFRYFAAPLAAEIVVDIMVLAAEIGGVAMALHLATGFDYRLFVPAVALVLWALLWFGNFSVIENAIAFLGLVTLAFVFGALRMHPSWTEVAHGAVPSLPSHDRASYWFNAVSIVGSVLQPFVLNFYASGAVEEKWRVKDLWLNRTVAGLGMSFGGAIALGLLVLAATVLGPRGMHVDTYEQAVPVLVGPFGEWGLSLFVAALGIACLGAAADVGLNFAYLLSQGFGWNWSENLKPHEDARFAAAYSAAVVPAALLVMLFDPLQVTLLTMALNAVIAPLIVFPLLILMNDKQYLRDHTNGVISNLLVSAVVILAFAVAVVAIPLEILGG
ncbi:MAG TPA: divalent metal cation transporter [Vicinamibacterales bacterium]|jgi:Mn2+/Fe2+ NRAMP family transporter|nr:divalent metal cation transporter [Vicinamibacterales bacterium]